MGFLLVFFPEEKGTIINKIKLPSSFIKPSNSSLLLSKAQFTISICGLLIFFTLLLFTLSTFEPSSSSSSSSSINFSSRRQLSQNPLISHQNSFVFRPYALQRMGTLYRRGTNAMTNLIVAHVVESLNLHDLKLFLRVLHKSSLVSRSDLLFLFPPKSARSLDSTILEENHSFLKLIQHYQEKNLFNSTDFTDSLPGFDPTQFVKWSKTEKVSAEPIWGRRSRSNSSEVNSTESTQLSYGSVVGFDVDELDPENSLAGFLEHVPMNLRRWACYPMLLGRIKRNFKHIMLVDVKEILLMGDPLNRVKNPSPDSVYLFSPSSHQSAPIKHGRKNSDRTRTTRSKTVLPSIILGGEKGVRRLSNSMLTEIVRKSVQQQKKKNPVTDSGVFNQLVGNEFLLTNVKLVKQTESIPELSSLSELKSKQGSEFPPVLRRGNSNFDVSFTVVKNLLCSSSLDTLFYSDC